ncbi:hypothetical protein [Microvirga antarctica]|uniref:hypothetical protein n=1 Tax=Microvirga antarctica TaxID=2819233 RepID=UPI001B30864B|nr:hypothetical protein [Microvirga antarctica]
MVETKLFGRLVALGMIAGLGACQGAGGSFSGSPEGIPIALESIDGPSSKVRTALIGELNTAATDRKVELVGATAQARYRVRGYLSAEKAEGGTKVAYVWDVFDSENKRAKRLTGTSPILVSYTSLAALDKETLARLANSSMDEIAEFLSASKAEAPVRTATVALDEEPVAAE